MTILYFRDRLRGIKRDSIGQPRIVSPRARTSSSLRSDIHERGSVGNEWEEGLVEAENDDWRVKCVAANQADTYKSPVGRSSLVSAIVSQDCDVRAALRNATQRNATHARNARTHAGRQALDTRSVCGSSGEKVRRVSRSGCFVSLHVTEDACVCVYVRVCACVCVRARACARVTIRLMVSHSEAFTTLTNA
jgi:hypothetical protein